MKCIQFASSQSYESVYALQKSLVQQRINEEIPDTLLIGEHPHVITLGRGTHAENILNTNNIPMVEIERGGDVTYHGPGQIVFYPIFKLEEGKRSLHGFLRNLEDIVIAVLNHYQIHGEQKPGLTGVWVDNRKVASIGIAVKKWVTYHGVSLNVNPDLGYYQHINPCGLPPDVMTSIHKERPECGDSCETIIPVIVQEVTTGFSSKSVLN